MRRFYAPPENFSDDTITLTTEETRHLRDVLRLKPDDEARVFDGFGREVIAVITEVGKSGATLRIIDEFEPAAPESALALTLVVSAYRSDKLDLVVQKSVELGVDRLTPIVTSRGEVKLSETATRLGRWRKIALEATKQCERARVMHIDEPLVFAEFLAGMQKEGPGLRLMFSEKDGGGIPAGEGGENITALIGPKGGWEDLEIEEASECGFVPVKLGRRIMRAETAAITFAALLQHRFGDLN
jgi:16S rRNA (uracil1498-N3)-methyltransferase